MISISNDDSMFYEDKMPRNVMVTANGKYYPFSVEKTILEIYQRIVGEDTTGTQINAPILNSDVPLIVKTSPNISTEIQREDIVRCINIEKREDAGDELKMGGEYRVIDIAKSNGQVIYYEVLDDSAPTKYRLVLRPTECELARKAKPKEKKIEIFQQVVKCESCKEEMVLHKIDDIYQGICEFCKTANVK